MKEKELYELDWFLITQAKYVIYSRNYSRIASLEWFLGCTSRNQSWKNFFGQYSCSCM